MNRIKLEEQVENILKNKNNNWQVSSNLHYKDPITKKPREKDIIATSVQSKNNDILWYYARLFIECKCLPTETEIYLANIDMSKEENVILAYDIPFAKIYEIERSKTHFYEYTEVFKAKDSGNHLYKAINQSLQSFAAFRKDSPQEKGIYYLIVVYDGKLKYGNRNLSNALIKIDTIDKVYNLPNKKCFIELVSIDQFENLLEKIEEDLKEINLSAYFYYKMEKNKIEEQKKKIREDKADSYCL